MKTIKLGFIATGARNRVYARNLIQQFGKKIKIGAVCDIDRESALEFKKQYCDKDTIIYDDYKNLLQEQKNIDGLIIAPPNYLHEEMAVPALKQGINILLEKPIAHTPESCMHIAQAYTESTAHVTIGFVLRYTPFYRTIIDMIRDGKVGSVKVVNADEVVGPVLSSLFFRTWRGKKQYTGGLLLEKCCHDLDLINTMLGVDPIRVAAFSSDNHYLPKTNYGPQCKVCIIKDSCSFSTVLWEKQIERGEDNGEYEYVDFKNDKCVYNTDHNLVDRQSQLIEYARGILVHFNVTLGGPETKRTIDIVGTDGRITGEFRENHIVYHQVNNESPEEISIDHERSGHGGGDSVITRSFIQSIEDPQYAPTASFKDGLKSALLAFLCDKARKEGKVLPVDYTHKIEAIRD